MSTLADIRPGQVLGRYEILAPIAQGGMASVWAARQWGSRGFSKIVAIKTMLPTISDDPRFERMFLDEARIASKIRHNHVVEILDLGEQNAVLYLVMELVDGESLSAIRRAAIEKSGVPIAVAVRIIADICSGLHAAHELCDDEGRSFGIVHRDVSPQNILVGYDGVAKILDFGVAKVAGRTSDTTNIGHARGKPPYMAPEQALGKVVDRRADIFSLGIVLYQLITGRHPFRGENDISTLHNIISDQPVVPPTAFLDSLPDGLESVMLRAIERDPSRRFQTAREMEMALDSLLDSGLGRIRNEEIGRLLTSWLGHRGEERRFALREAIRRADCVDPTQAVDASAGGTDWSTRRSGSNSEGYTGEKTRDVSPGIEWPSARVSFGSGSGQLETSLSLSLQRKGEGESESESSSDACESTADGNERTVVDLSPKWRDEPLGVNADTKEYVVSQIPGKSRSLIIVLLAMSVGAAITWLVYTLNGHRQTVSMKAVPTVVILNEKVPTTLSVESNSVAPVATIPNDTGDNRGGSHSAVPTVINDSRITRVAPPSNTQTRNRTTIPAYHLPPVPSPGF